MASAEGGVIIAFGTDLFWDGYGTQFITNSATFGDEGAMVLTLDSTVPWNGDGTYFSGNTAGSSGGAISADHTRLLCDANTTFINNVAGGGDGGAITLAATISDSSSYYGAISESSTSFAYDSEIYPLSDFSMVDGTFIGNAAAGDGGAIYMKESGSTDRFRKRHVEEQFGRRRRCSGGLRRWKPRL